MVAASAKSETLLVVDDEPEVLAYIALVLKKEGYNVLCAQSGEEGLQISRQQVGKIALLLTDIVMPGMNGGELYRQITLYQPKIQVLYMSGYTKYTVVAQGAPESVTSFIWKPFSAADLLQKVHELLDSPCQPY
jgi:two-component system cell cycle sensor histidine kinase/response regulator CckA